MSRVAEAPLEKVTLNIVEGDKETLQRFYHSMGWSVAARRILNDYCEQLRKLANHEGKALSVKIDLSRLEERPDSKEYS